MRMYEGKVTFAVVWLGGRASAYLAALREFYPDGHAVVAVADPDPKKRLRAAREYAVPESGLFETDLELMEQPRLADVAIVGTQDALHYRETVALLEKAMTSFWKNQSPPKWMCCWTCAGARLHTRIRWWQCVMCCATPPFSAESGRLSNRASWGGW